MNTADVAGCARGVYRRTALIRQLFGIAAGLAVCLRAESVGAQQATQPAERIANTARTVVETPADTVVTHRASPWRARGGDAGEGQVLPARSGGAGKSLGFSDGWYLTGLISLSAVLILIFLLSYLARRFVLPGARLGGRELEVLARSYLGNKQSIAIVKAGRRLMVVGVTANRISLLTCLDDPAETAELLGNLAARKPGSITSQFANRLEAESERYQDSEPGELPYRDERPEFAVRTRQQLRAAIGRMRRFARQEGTGRPMGTGAGLAAGRGGAG